MSQRRRRRSHPVDGDPDTYKQYALATDTRKLVLDAYANRISSRSSSLDTRATSLRSGEQSLRDWEIRLRAKESQLSEMELSVRREMTAFLDNLARRERHVAELEVSSAESLREARAAAAAVAEGERTFSQRLDSASGQLSHLSHVADELQRTRQGLQTAERAKDTIEAELVSHRAELDALISERDRLLPVVERARGMESAASELKNALAAREVRLAAQERRISVDLPKIDVVNAALEIFRDFIRKELGRQNGRTLPPLVGLTDQGVAELDISELCLVVSDMVLRISADADAIERMRIDAESRSSALQSREVNLLREMRQLATKRAVVELDVGSDSIKRGVCEPQQSHVSREDDGFSPLSRNLVSQAGGGQDSGMVERDFRPWSPGFGSIPAAHEPPITGDNDGTTRIDGEEGIDVGSAAGHPHAGLSNGPPQVHGAERQDVSIIQGAASRPLHRSSETTREFRKEAIRDAQLSVVVQPSDQSGATHFDPALDERLNNFLASRWLWKERVAKLLTVLETLIAPAQKHDMESVVLGVRVRLSRLLEEADCPDMVAEVQSPDAVRKEQVLQRRWASELQYAVDVVHEIQAGILHAGTHGGRVPNSSNNSAFGQGKRGQCGIDNFLYGVSPPTRSVGSDSEKSERREVLDSLTDVALQSRVRAALQGYEELSKAARTNKK